MPVVILPSARRRTWSSTLRLRSLTSCTGRHWSADFAGPAGTCTSPIARSARLARHAASTWPTLSRTARRSAASSAMPTSRSPSAGPATTSSATRCTNVICARVMPAAAWTRPKPAISAASSPRRGAPRFFSSSASNQRLLGVAVTDACLGGLSAVYTFFDPDESARSLGTYAILQQVRDGTQPRPALALPRLLDRGPPEDGLQAALPPAAGARREWLGADAAGLSPAQPAG